MRQEVPETSQAAASQPWWKRIRTESTQNDLTALDARRPEFKNRNRYRDVSPYDHSRVRLHRDEIDYINANIIDAPEAGRSYILTQGPLPSTCGHFWLMVWEQNSKAVLMLNRTMERGRGPVRETCGHFWLMVWERKSKAILMLNNLLENDVVKCHQYYPMGEQNFDVDDMVFKEEGLRVSYVDETNYRHFTVRTIQLYDFETETSKEVLQFHYTTWLDFKVPSLSCFLNYLNAVRESGALSPDVGPPVIHCSAGIGRSGTFCLVDTCLVLIEKQGSMAGVNVQQLLMDMRQQRMGLIQTHEQLKFSYEAIIEGAKRILSGTDLGYCDPSEMENEEYPPRTQNPRVNLATDANNIMSASREESDSDTPPPLPPRQRPPPPPPPTSPPPEDDDDDIYNDLDIEVQKFKTSGLEEVKQPNGELDAINEALKLLREPEPEPVKTIPRELTEDERREGVALRKRIRDERIKSTKEQIERMKQRQTESEKWRQRQLPFSPVLLGVGLVGMAGLFFLYRYYFSS